MPITSYCHSHAMSREDSCGLIMLRAEWRFISFCTAKTSAETFKRFTCIEHFRVWKIAESQLRGRSLEVDFGVQRRHYMDAPYVGESHDT
jgi:hypothetical protein